jgi:exopolysaccharide production protein ExoZ
MAQNSSHCANVLAAHGCRHCRHQRRRATDFRASFCRFKSDFHVTFFLPDIREGNPVVDPILYVGWSLNFEMMFYLIFCFCLFFRTAFPRFIAVIAAIIALWTVGYVSSSPYLQYFGSNIVLAFAAGGCIWFATTQFKMPRALAIAVFCVAWAGIAWPDFSPSSSESVKSLVTILAATAIVYSAVSLNDQGITVGDGILSEQGASSYALYLVHPFVLQLFSKFARTYVSLSPIPLLIGAACLFVASVVAAVVFYRFVEVPLTRLLRSKRSAVQTSTQPAPLPS